MTRISPFLASAAFGLLAPAAFAGDMQVFPYNAAENYCPAGLQPVVMGGAICCGTPTTERTYREYNAHPAPVRASHVSRPSTDYCPEGQKGCF